jgi:hypothetical protein
MNNFPQSSCVSSPSRQLPVASDGGNFQGALRSSLYLLSLRGSYAGVKLVWVLQTAQVPQLAGAGGIGR